MSNYDINEIAEMITEDPNIILEKGWPTKLKKGRFTEYCKKAGFKGPCRACAKKAMKSKSSSVRGMASFYLNTTLKNPKTKG